MFDTLVIVGLVLWVLLSTCLLLGLLYAAPTLLRLREVTDRMHRLTRMAEKRLPPLLDQIERVAHNANSISSSVRRDIGTMSESVDRTTGTLDRIVAMMEERATELNGLLEVIQREAEEAFFSTATALRFVRRLGRGGKKKKEEKKQKDGQRRFL